MRRWIPHSGRPAVLFFLLPMALACGAAPKDWGNEPLRGRVAALRPADIIEASIALDECPRRPRPIGQATLAELLRQVSLLAPASDIGMREEWEEWRLIRLTTTAGETFEIDVSTRESLRGKPIVVFGEDPFGRIGFYAGEAFWSWLKETPESAALARGVEGPDPCS